MNVCYNKYRIVLTDKFAFLKIGVFGMKKQIVRMAVDLAMTVILLLLVGYSRIGETAHEWLGITMTALFAAHHILNRKWISAVFHGKYTPFRLFQTVITVLLCCTFIGSAVSGIIVSKHIFASLFSGGASVARTVHMLCGYWNFVLMSLHLGLHWIAITGMVSKKLPKNKTALKWTARAVAFLIAGYGVYALIYRQVADYLFGRTMFAFFDASEPLILFYLDYIAIMGLFVFAGHYISKALKLIK